MIKKKYETADLLHSRILVNDTNPDENKGTKSRFEHCQPRISVNKVSINQAQVPRSGFESSLGQFHCVLG